MKSDVETRNTHPSDSIAQQTVSFIDSNKGDVVAYEAPEHKYLTSDSQQITSLGKFLERPTLIDTVSWSSAGLSTTAIYPWQALMENAYVAKKIANYAFFRGTLNVKFVMNANPFVYGACLVSYVPVHTNITEGDGTHSILNRSQKPHIWMYPQSNTGGELESPFIYHMNYVDLTYTNNIKELGELTLTEVIALDTANDVTIPDLSVQVYAWFTDVDLTGPTTSANLQGNSGRDEYSMGPVERISSAVATASGALASAPTIGPFALATSIGASAVAGIASIFGWTKVPIIEDAKPVKNVQFVGLSSSEISDSKEKFTLDPKAELSTDPGVVNLKNTDELQISYLVQKESYANSTTWTSASAVGSQLLMYNVTPCLWEYTNGSIYHTVPGYISRMFQHWRGDMIFRFKIIATEYHRGRLRITWDPRGIQTGTTDYSNVAYTKIVDISEINDFEFRVPYLQTRPWQKCCSGGVQNMTTSTTPTYEKYFHNGTLRVQVLTTLSSPQATPSCSIIAFAYGSDTLEFANPRNIERSLTHLELQSDSVETGKVLPERYLINWGENITNLRTLMRRAQKSQSLPIESDTESFYGLVKYESTCGRFPQPWGFTSAAPYVADEVVGASTSEFSFGKTTYINWIAPMFALNRGSIQHTLTHIAPNTSNMSCQIAAVRTTDEYNVDGDETLQAFKPTKISENDDTPQVFYQRGYVQDTPSFDTGPGVAIINEGTQSSLALECPMMVPAVACYNDQNQWLIGNEDDQSVFDRYKYLLLATKSSAAAGVIEKYVNIGTDFNLYFFLGCPEVYYDITLGDYPIT